MERSISQRGIFRNLLHKGKVEPKPKRERVVPEGAIDRFDGANTMFGVTGWVAWLAYKLRDTKKVERIPERTKPVKDKNYYKSGVYPKAMR
tara:strand:- start:592 stop:864 length:273 start_codon:yes stop_codon:yes gene_type:complete